MKHFFKQNVVRVLSGFVATFYLMNVFCSRTLLDVIYFVCLFVRLFVRLCFYVDYNTFGLILRRSIHLTGFPG